MTADAGALEAGGCGEITAAARAAGDLELPRPPRLLVTAGWNLTESALVVAGAGTSTLWFLWVLRRLGLRVRFAAALCSTAAPGGAVGPAQ